MGSSGKPVASGRRLLLGLGGWEERTVADSRDSVRGQWEVRQKFDQPSRLSMTGIECRMEWKGRGIGLREGISGNRCIGMYNCSSQRSLNLRSFIETFFINLFI
jgi:hypothetical protein